jgi:hypothetical protein
MPCSTLVLVDGSEGREVKVVYLVSNLDQGLVFGAKRGLPDYLIGRTHEYALVYHGSSLKEICPLDKADSCTT